MALCDTFFHTSYNSFTFRAACFILITFKSKLQPAVGQKKASRNKILVHNRQPKRLFHKVFLLCFLDLYAIPRFISNFLLIHSGAPLILIAPRPYCSHNSFFVAFCRVGFFRQSPLRLTFLFSDRFVFYFVTGVGRTPALTEAATVTGPFGSCGGGGSGCGRGGHKPARCTRFGCRGKCQRNLQKCKIHWYRKPTWENIKKAGREKGKFTANEI